MGLEGVSAGGNPGRHWESRDALTSTQLSFMAGRGRNCDCGPAEVDAALGYLSVLEGERASREKVGSVKKEIGQGNSPLAVATFRDDLSLIE